MKPFKAIFLGIVLFLASCSQVTPPSNQAIDDTAIAPLINGNFEAGLTGWVKYGGSASLITPGRNGTGQALQTTNYAWMQQNLPIGSLKKNQNYTLTAYARAASTHAVCTVGMAGGNSAGYTFRVRMTFRETTWTQKSLTHLLPADATWFAVFTDTPNGRCQFDDIVLQNFARAWKPVGTNPLNALSSNDTSEPVIAIDNSGYPVVAWYEYKTGFIEQGGIVVKRWNGSSWVQLGDPVYGEFFRFGIVPTPYIYMSNNQPVIAWTEWSGTTNKRTTYVKRWNGTTWEQVGPAIPDTFVYGLVVDSQGRPVLATIPIGLVGNIIHILRYNGTSWELLKESGSTFGVRSLHLAIDNTDTIVFAHGYRNVVSLWFGKDTTWTQGPFVGGFADDMVLDNKGCAIIPSHNANSFDTYNLTTTRTCPSGSWKVLGQELYFLPNYFVDVSLALENNLPVMSVALDDGRLEIWRYNGRVWVKQVNPAITNWVEGASLKFASGKLYAAWAERKTGSEETRVFVSSY
jgi:hypothetical protein